ncbi:MAG: sugar phosphate nucleotidyltransferase, partial [Pseudomonadota bacterium]
PLLQFALDEALAAGAKRLVFVSHPDKSAIEDYVRPAPVLEEALTRKGKSQLLDAIRATALPGDVDVVFAMQSEPLGLGHAVRCAAAHISAGPVGVILPDDLILGAPCLEEMAQAFDPTAMQSLIAAQRVEPQHVSSYGIFDCDEGQKGRAVPAAGLVEKPAFGAAPSTLAAVGRYILQQDIFDALRNTAPGAGGEIQLTDAIAARGGIHAFRFSGDRYDCGDKDGMVDATLAVQRARRRGHLQVAAE